MTCSICFECGHNKRTCPHQTKTPCKDTPTASEVRVANVLGAILSPDAQCRKCSVCGEHGHNKRTCPQARKCSLCGAHGHNKRTCPLTEIEKENVENAGQRKCSLCGAEGHNKRTCPLTEIEKENVENAGQRKCSLCGAEGHNKRTCTMKCIPCSDQVARGYCFAGMSDKMAVKIAKVLDCTSIYGEAEEYPQFERAKETITFANGETIDIDLGAK